MDKAFEKWVEDLEARLALRLFQRPEETKLLTNGKIKVEVKPHDYVLDTWCVVVDGKETSMFFGRDAQLRASRMASNILNNESNLK